VINQLMKLADQD